MRVKPRAAASMIIFYVNNNCRELRSKKGCYKIAILQFQSSLREDDTDNALRDLIR